MRRGALRAACALLALVLGGPARGTGFSLGLSLVSPLPSDSSFSLGLEPSHLGGVSASAVPQASTLVVAVPPGLDPLPLVRLRNEDRSYGKKFLRGAAIIGTAEACSMIVLAVLPRSVTQWDEHPVDKAAQNLKRAWTQPPVWDHDVLFHNYVGHPYVGSIYYNMVRSQGATPLESFLFSTAQSVIFEYVVEAVAEQPSIQDLMITSTIGSVIGELFHRLTLDLMKKERLTFLQKALLLVMNPSFVLNNGFSPPRRPR